MNDVYFACRTCQLYMDAGYRWTQTLPNTIQRGQKVDMEAVFSATEYWRGVEGDTELHDLLNQIKFFLEAHRNHDVIFGEDDNFHHYDAASLDWMEVEIETESSVRNAIEHFWGPRDFAEKLGYTHWEQVVEHIAKLDWGSWWFDDMELRFAGRRKFEWYVRAIQKLQ